MTAIPAFLAKVGFKKKKIELTARQEYRALLEEVANTGALAESSQEKLDSLAYDEGRRTMEQVAEDVAAVKKYLELAPIVATLPEATDKMIAATQKRIQRHLEVKRLLKEIQAETNKIEVAENIAMNAKTDIEAAQHWQWRLEESFPWIFKPVQAPTPAARPKPVF